MASLGDLFWELRARDTKLSADITTAAGKAGDKAGKTFSEKFAKGVQQATGAIAGGIAVALGAGLISRFGQLERATADFRRETGATADEATRAGQAINDMAGRNIQSVETIGRTLTAVTTQWGIHGDAAEKAAEQVLKFAQATGIDAETAVKGLDDVQDAWNLTAADSQAIMDKLVVSHQKYGGSIDGNLQALKDLAPAMQAANFSYDDGIGLLGMFAAAGVDAAAAPRALQTALSKVKSPEQLKAMLKDIAGTEDDFKRGGKAADLFGIKAGQKLSQALKGANIDDFKVSLEDAAGATDKAADASLTLADKVKLAFSNIASTVVDTLGPAGPMIQGIAGLSTLLGPTLGGLGKKMGIALGAAIGAAMGPEIAAAMTAETGMVGPLLIAAKALGTRLGIEISAAMVPLIVTGIAGAFAAKDWMSPIIGRATEAADAGTRAFNEAIARGLSRDAAIDYSVRVWNGVVEAQKTILDPEKAYQAGVAYANRFAGGIKDGVDKAKGLIPKLRASIFGDPTGAGGAEGIDPRDRALKAYNDYIKRLYDTVENERRAAEKRFLGQSEHNRLSTLDHMVPWVKPLQNLGPKLKMWLRPIPAIVEEAVAPVPLTFAEAFGAVGAIVTASFKTVKGQVNKTKFVFQHALTDARDEIKLRMAEVYEEMTKPTGPRLRKALKEGMEKAQRAMNKAHKAGNEEAYALAKQQYDQLKAKVDAIDKLHATVHIAWGLDDVQDAFADALAAIKKGVKNARALHRGLVDPITGVPHLATGLARVPHDNYLAYLHKDEAVVPAAQNMQGSWGGTRRMDWYVHDVGGGLARAGISIADLTQALRRWEE